MFVPDSFPAELRSSLRQLFFGTVFSPQLAVLTPLGSLFDPWSKPGDGSSGWWKAARVGEVLFINSRQGSAVLDAICCLEPGTSIFYAGLAGSCGSCKVGDVVEAGSAFWQGTEVPAAWIEASEFPRVTVATVSCLAESYERREEIAQFAECVDMETALLFLACERQNKNARSVQVISDHLFEDPFHVVQPAAYAAGIERLRDYVNELCASRCRRRPM